MEVSVSVLDDISAFLDFAKRVSIKVSVSVFLTVNGLLRFLIGFRSRFVSVILSVSVFDSGFFKDSINLFAIFLFYMRFFGFKYNGKICLFVFSLNLHCLFSLFFF